MAFPTTLPTKPPDLCGYAPLKAPLVDSRWLKVKDAPSPQVRYRGDAICNKVDAWVNYAIKYRRDIGDIWALPEETYARLYGDCEDIALLKRAILKRSGAPEECIYFILANDILAYEIHSFLVVKEDIWRLLDNRNSLSMPVENARDYVPMLAFSGNNAWLYGKRKV